MAHDVPIGKQSGGHVPQKAESAHKPRSPEQRIERLRNRAERRYKRWREQLRARIGRDRDRVRQQIAEIRASLDATQISDKGLQMIGNFEGFLATAYHLAGEQFWTIGYGHYGPDVHPGQTITRDAALALLRKDASTAAAAVRSNVHVTLSQTEFDALVSFTFNVGPGAFASSTLLRLLNAGDRAGAAAQFSRWVSGATGPLPGLVTRRAAERDLFQLGRYPS